MYELISEGKKEITFNKKINKLEKVFELYALVGILGISKLFL